LLFVWLLAAGSSLPHHKPNHSTPKPNPKPNTRTEALEGGCQLDTALLYEVVADDVMTLLLPINVMRNYGLLQARTRLITMVDVDLIVSSALSDWMADPKNVDFLHKECAAKRVYVLPAFETPRSPDASAAHKVAGDAVAGDKAALEALVAKKLVHQFALYLFREGHNMTEYNKWFRADKPYPVSGWFLAVSFAVFWGGGAVLLCLLPPLCTQQSSKPRAHVASHPSTSYTTNNHPTKTGRLDQGL
jgi:hypothetical protein